MVRSDLTSPTQPVNVPLGRKKNPAGLQIRTDAAVCRQQRKGNKGKHPKQRPANRWRNGGRYLLANHLAQLVDILEQHVVVRHGHSGKRGCSPQDRPPTRFFLKGGDSWLFKPPPPPPLNKCQCQWKMRRKEETKSVAAKESQVSRLATLAGVRGGHSAAPPSVESPRQVG